MYVLVINAGSSSLKYQLLDKDTQRLVGKGLCEKVGSEDSFHRHGLDGDERLDTLPLKDHHDAVQAALRALLDPQGGAVKGIEEIAAVGHRVVHGGEHFSASSVIDDEVVARIRECIPLAPLHNPPALTGIEACADLMPHALQVAVFDTAFHQTLPPKAYLYPLPYELYERHRVRTYGFHGTSHRYVAQRAAALLGRPLDELRLITCHLGNGCSVTAVRNGVSVDTSMGFTPLEGLMMGTRCGSIDPAVVTYLIGSLGMGAGQVDDLMNRRSGLLGVSGVSNDLRDVQAAADAGDERAQLACEMYADSVRRHIGQYVFELAGVDAVVLTAGVGENSDRIRQMIFSGLEPLGFLLDGERNRLRGFERVISSEGSPVRILVVPTNEELMIAQDVASLLDA
ncbi:MAG: acetate kinase [Coriobacteriales bacterium]|jgi:acetate kinase|nr:acetate kinase [Coriobacteriales bacterium]